MIKYHLNQNFMIIFIFCSDLILQTSNILTIMKVSLLVTTCICIYLLCGAAGVWKKIFQTSNGTTFKKKINTNWDAIYFFWCLKKLVQYQP